MEATLQQTQDFEQVEPQVVLSEDGQNAEEQNKKKSFIPSIDVKHSSAAIRERLRSNTTGFIASASHAVKTALLGIWAHKLFILAVAVLLASALMIAAFTVNPALLPAGVAAIVSTIIAAGLSQLAVVGIAATTGTAAAAYLIKDATVPSLPKASTLSMFKSTKATDNVEPANESILDETATPTASV